MATKKTTKYIVERRRDGDMSPVYACVKGTDGEVISTKVPLGVAVELDDNIIKSLKQRTEMVRIKGTKESDGETLVARPTYSIEKV
jgi:hypothetical protein